MAMADAGRVIILPKGNWSSLISYEMLDLVSGSDNKGYLARQSNVNIDPTTDDGTYWQVFGSTVSPDNQTIKEDANGKVYVNIDSDTIKYDSENGYLYVDANEIEKAFSDLTDASISSPSNGQVLVYNATSGKWENQTLTITSSLSGLTDTDISTPTNGQVLKYNSTSQKWENAEDSGAVITLTVSCDSAFQGETVTISKGGVSLTESVGAGLSVSFTVPSLGTWTISNSLNANTDTIDIQFYGNYTYSLIALPDGSTITPTDDIQTLLNCANIWDKNYTTLSELLADTTTLQTVISSNNAVDYLVRSTTFAKQITVPKMTSNTTPSGEVATSGVEGSYYAWYAFDGQGTATAWLSANGMPQYISYDFGTQVRVARFAYNARNVGAVGGVKDYKIQGSNDNFVSDVNDLYTGAAQNESGVVREFSLSTTGDYRYYRMYLSSDWESSGHAGLYTLQFYSEEGLCDNATAMSYIGLNNYASNTLLANATWCEAICNSPYFESVLNVKVPTMTSNTTPSGTCFASTTVGGGFLEFKAFDNDDATAWASANNTTTNQYLGYDFGTDVKIYKMLQKYLASTPTGNPKNAKVQCDVNGTWTDVGSAFVCSQSADTVKILNPSVSSKKWRLYMSDNYGYQYIYVPTLQFYGRADV